jgi:hypothetical protein
MRIVKRVLAIAAVAVLTGAAPAFASAATAPATAAGGNHLYNDVAGTEAGNSAGFCEAYVLSTRLSASDPAYVTMLFGNVHAGTGCTGSLERSAHGGPWQTVSRGSLPSAGSLVTFRTTPDYYDGPGYRARACFTMSGVRGAACTSAVSLAKGSGTPASQVIPVSYVHVSATSHNSSLSAVCVGAAAASSNQKTASATVTALFIGTGGACAGSLQASTNGGKTWHVLTDPPAYGTKSDVTARAAITGRYADGRGDLVRICVKLNSNPQTCSKGW